MTSAVMVTNLVQTRVPCDKRKVLCKVTSFSSTDVSIKKLASTPDIARGVAGIGEKARYLHVRQHAIDQGEEEKCSKVCYIFSRCSM